MAFARKARPWLAGVAVAMAGWASMAGATTLCNITDYTASSIRSTLRGANAGFQHARGRIAALDAVIRAARTRPTDMGPLSVCLDSLVPEILAIVPDAPVACASGGSIPAPYVVSTGVVALDPVDTTPDPSATVHVYELRYQFLLDVLSPEASTPLGPVIGSTLYGPYTMAQCSVAPSVIGFFNGVTTTELEATDNLKGLRAQFGNARDTTPLRYETFYNQTGCGSGRKGGCLEDFVETFQQRDRELGGVLKDRFETFWEVMQGSHEDPVSQTSQTTGLLGKIGAAFLDLVRSVAQAVEAKIISVTAGLIANPPTAEDEARHLKQLIAIDDAKMGAVLVAHSQGNLFVNTAFDAIRKQRPQSIVRVVHVAPASPTLRGDYVLGDTDVVINGLRVFNLGTVPASNVQVPEDPVDKLSHNFIATYMDAKRPARARLIQLIEPSLDAL